MGMGNWNHAQKLDHCKQSSFLPFGIVINERHFVPFTDAVDNTIRGLPNDENQVYTVHLLCTRVQALLDHHSDLLTFEPRPDIVSFCLKLYECLWGSDAPPGHRSTWFCKGIYTTQTFVQNPDGELYQSSIIYQEDLNKVMEHLIDSMVAVVTLIRQSRTTFAHALHKEQRMCADAIYRIMRPGTSGISLLSFFKRDESYYRMRGSEACRETVSTFKILKKTLRAHLIKQRWENMVLKPRV
jgi:hypothetical protein